MISFDEFETKYKPIKNHLNEDRGYDGCAFETFGEELNYVCKFNVKQVSDVFNIECRLTLTQILENENC